MIFICDYCHERFECSASRRIMNKVFCCRDHGYLYGRLPLVIKARFWSCVQKDSLYSCWLWTKTFSDGGYDLFSYSESSTFMCGDYVKMISI